MQHKTLTRAEVVKDFGAEVNRRLHEALTAKRQTSGTIRVQLHGRYDIHVVVDYTMKRMEAHAGGALRQAIQNGTPFELSRAEDGTVTLNIVPVPTRH